MPTEITLRFPLGTYQAQSPSAFEEAEWPPHPVRLVAALVAAAAVLPDDDRVQARAALQRLSESRDPPIIIAPRVAGPGLEADGRDVLMAVRGVSQWAPRNHELAELGGGVHPRDLGRRRAEIHQNGVAVGSTPVTFSFSTDLDDVQHAALERAAEEIAYLGTSRSPAMATVRRSSAQLEPAYRVADGGMGVSVRVPTPALIEALDAWHARREQPTGRSGAPARTGLVTPAPLGRIERYRHDEDVSGVVPFDPEWWGDMLIVAVDPTGDLHPKGPATYSFARALRAALLAQYARPGVSGEAPSLLRARGGEPHAAVVPLPVVGHDHADGRLMGAAIVLPHPARLSDVLEQRREVEQGLGCLISGAARPSVGTPGVGDIHFVPTSQRPGVRALSEARWRQTATFWSSVTPVVHSRHRRHRREDALLEQVAADCRDVGLPEPSAVEVRRTSRFTAGPATISRRHLPASWAGPLRGPVDHLDLEFDHPVVGPLLLGRARHFGLGLCLPTPGTT